MSLSDTLCEYCNKTFSTKGNCKAHKVKCKIKNKKELVSFSTENIDLKSLVNKKEEELKKKEEELLQKEEQINFLKSLLMSYSEKPNIFNYNSNNNSNNVINNNLNVKNLVSNLDPIDFEDIKDSMDNYSTKYIDKGLAGFAKFLCDYPCKDKFITTDYTRNTIAYKTKDAKFMRDNEGSYLINRSIKENRDKIIEKTTDRLEKINVVIKTFKNEDIDDFIKTKNAVKKLKNKTENISEEDIRDKDTCSVLTKHGITTVQKHLNNETNIPEIKEN